MCAHRVSQAHASHAWCTESCSHATPVVTLIRMADACGLDRGDSSHVCIPCQSGARITRVVYRELLTRHTCGHPDTCTHG